MRLFELKMPKIKKFPTRVAHDTSQTPSRLARGHPRHAPPLDSSDVSVFLPLYQKHKVDAYEHMQRDTYQPTTTDHTDQSAA